MKKLLLLFTLPSLIACAGMTLKGYNGMPFDTYVQRKGLPLRTYNMNNGHKLYFYRAICSDKINYEEYNVEANENNIIEGITYVKMCPIISQNN